MADQKTPQLDQLSYNLRNRYAAYQSLRQLIKRTKDKAALADLGALAMCLANADSSEPFFDLYIWSGLLIDTPDMGEEYGQGVQQCDYLQYLWDERASSSPDKGNRPNKQTKSNEELKPARLIAQALICVMARAGRDTERQSGNRLCLDLTSYLKAELNAEEFIAWRDFYLAVINRTSFFSAFYTYQRCRELFADLPEQLNSTWRRRIRNSIEHISWPDDKSARAAQKLAEELNYKSES